MKVNKYFLVAVPTNELSTQQSKSLIRKFMSATFCTDKTSIEKRFREVFIQFFIKL